jgi:phosphatidylinositol alpha 1,6-mannosyltransferase
VFADAVARLAADPDLRAVFAAAGRRKVPGRTWTALTDELIGHYAAVLGRSRRPATFTGNTVAI